MTNKTRYFPAFIDAYKHYKAYGYKIHDILNKIYSGEIEIGPPQPKGRK